MGELSLIDRCAGYVFLQSSGNSDLTRSDPKHGKDYYFGYVRDWNKLKNGVEGVRDIMRTFDKNMNPMIYDRGQKHHEAFRKTFNKYKAMGRFNEEIPEDGALPFCAVGYSHTPLNFIEGDRVVGQVRMKDISEIDSDEPAYGITFITNDNFSDIGGRSGHGVCGTIVTDEKTLGYIAHDIFVKKKLRFKTALKEIFPAKGPELFAKKENSLYILGQ